MSQNVPACGFFDWPVNTVSQVRLNWKSDVKEKSIKKKFFFSMKM